MQIPGEGATENAQKAPGGLTFLQGTVSVTLSDNPRRDFRSPGEDRSGHLLEATVHPVQTLAVPPRLVGGEGLEPTAPCV